MAFEQAAIGMALVGLDGRLLRVNQALCDLLGRAPSELVGASLSDLTECRQLARACEELARGRQPSPCEVERRFARPDGGFVDLQFSVTPLCDAQGRTLGLLGQAGDVTERNQATRALRTNESWLRSVIANAPIVLSVYNRDGICTFSEGRAFERIGISPKERVGRSYAELRGDVAEANADFERLLAGEEVSAKRQVTPRRPDGEAVFDVRYRPLPAVDGGDEVAGVISLAVDVTDLKRVERERRSLLHQLITAQESEQRRLAGNLHDDAIQALTAAHMQLSVLQARLDGVVDVEAAAEVRCLARQVRENLEQGLRAARTFLFDLRPPLLDQEGLAPALGQQLDKLAERCGCDARFDWEVAERLDPDLEVLVFRAVQEALANVAKHARAGSVQVRGWRDGPTLEVEVLDDGVGFDQGTARTQAVSTGHIGLRSMAERVEAAGGTLAIDAAPELGARVRVSVPVLAWAP
ncbi:MAG TPA: PAS domain-containing sensor histidine kinase [Actinomycetes bacterium]|jgi:PAS domain S-box-containing protein|nr:PAS domain-containing sensor histidine kinase [Actinomycetes bacterium]